MAQVSMQEWLAAHNERVGRELAKADGESGSKADGNGAGKASEGTDLAVVSVSHKDVYERIVILRAKEAEATSGLLRIQYDIGVALREAKEYAGKGNWGALFEDGTIQMTQGTASRYMRLANGFESFEDLLDAVGGGEDGFGGMNMTKILALIRERDGNADRGTTADNTPPKPKPKPVPTVDVDAEIDKVALCDERGVLLERAREENEAQQKEIDMLKAKLEQAENLKREDAKARKKADRDNGRETLVKVIAERDALKAENKKLKARVNTLEADNANLIHLRAGTQPPVLAVA